MPGYHDPEHQSPHATPISGETTPFSPYSPPPIPRKGRNSWKSRILSLLAIIYKAKVLLLFGSVVLSMLVYGLAFGWAFGIGLVILIAIHESGHVLANRKRHIPASWPTFIPFLGAVINIRQSPRNADDEAFIGIAGPIFGLAATLVCYGLYLTTHLAVLQWLAVFGFFMHIFNLIPVVPLDGGRTVAFLGWKAWGPGLIGLLVLLFFNPLTGTLTVDPVSVIILIFIVWNFIGRLKHPVSAAYNAIATRRKWTYGLLWAGLMGLSIVGYLSAGSPVWH
ncbi:MAG: site-2 protease family protein [Sulfobacillus thermotolerans]|nr:site-2 protease family protein [Sulfobacillus thermotolerans]